MRASAPCTCAHIFPAAPLCVQIAQGKVRSKQTRRKHSQSSSPRHSELLALEPPKRKVKAGTISWLRQRLRAKKVGVETLLDHMGEGLTHVTFDAFASGLKAVGVKCTTRICKQLFALVDINGEHSVDIDDLRRCLRGRERAAPAPRRKRRPNQSASTRPSRSASPKAGDHAAPARHETSPHARQGERQRRLRRLRAAEQRHKLPTQRGGGRASGSPRSRKAPRANKKHDALLLEAQQERIASKQEMEVDPNPATRYPDPNPTPNPHTT